MTSNQSVLIPEEDEAKSEDSGSRSSSQLNKSMSMLNCSLNADSNFMSNNVYSEHKSTLMKSKISGFEVNLNRKEEPSAEQMLDYLVNLNKLLKVKTQSYKKKFLRWKEMNFYKVGLTAGHAGAQEGIPPPAENRPGARLVRQEPEDSPHQRTRPRQNRGNVQLLRPAGRPVLGQVHPQSARPDSFGA